MNSQHVSILDRHVLINNQRPEYSAESKLRKDLKIVYNLRR